MPYLTYLSVFSYGFTPEGNLVYPKLDDTFMITAANNFGTAPAITLTPFGEDGQFNNNLISRIGCRFRVYIEGGQRYIYKFCSGAYKTAKSTGVSGLCGFSAKDIGNPAGTFI